jgi:hypothetical protein
MLDSKALKDDETSFGVFYPKDYVLSVFADPAAGERAAAALEVAGFDTSDVVVAGSDDVLANHREFTADLGLVGRFRQFLSRHFDDQADLLNDVVAHARQGHTFVLAYAPDGKQTERAANALRPLHPVILRKYGANAVKEL